MFQSARPRGRTRHAGYLVPFFVDVSIRASSREDATPLIKLTILTTMVSIRASSREDATRIFDEIDHEKLVSIRASSREDATVSVEGNINQNVIFAKARRE